MPASFAAANTWGAPHSSSAISPKRRSATGENFRCVERRRYANAPDHAALARFCRRQAVATGMLSAFRNFWVGEGVNTAKMRMPCETVDRYRGYLPYGRNNLRLLT